MRSVVDFELVELAQVVEAEYIAVEVGEECIAVGVGVVEEAELGLDNYSYFGVVVVKVFAAVAVEFVAAAAVVNVFVRFVFADEIVNLLSIVQLVDDSFAAAAILVLVSSFSIVVVVALAAGL